MKKHMKDRPGLLDDAQRIAQAGRKGDKLIAHITPEEAALLKARGGSGTVNPRTGLLEFYDGGESGSDMSGGGNAGNMGGAWGGDGYAGSTNDGYLPGEPVAMPGGGVAMGPVNPGTFHDSGGLPDWAAQMPQMPYRPTLLQDPRHYIGVGIDHLKTDIANKPFSTLAGLAMPGGTIARAFGLSPWSDAIDGIKGLFSTDAKPEGQTEGEMESDTSPQSQPTERTESGDANYQQIGLLGQNMMANAQQPGQVAQDAVRRAFMVNPQAYNSWDFNRFVIPQVRF